MRPRLLSLIVLFILVSCLASSTDAIGRVRRAALPTSNESRISVLLNRAEAASKRDEALIARAEEASAQTDSEIRRVDALLVSWEAKTRPQSGVVYFQQYIPWVISFLALFVALRNYHRKTGVLLRGSFRLSSSKSSDDSFVSRIALENLKDRAVTIFGIYLRVGHNFYIKVEDREESPLILKAYESYHKEYGPIHFYGINSNRVNLNKLLNDNKVAKRIVVSTSDGRYVIPARIRIWNPVVDYFSNHMTATLRPVRLSYKGTDVGKNVKFVIDFVGDNGESEVSLIHADDFRVRKFRAFQLTSESLETTESLTAFLSDQQAIGTLQCTSFTVHDLKRPRERTDEHFRGPVIEGKFYGFFHYHIWGRLGTRLADRQLRKINARPRPVAHASGGKGDTDESLPPKPTSPTNEQG